jgi:hypothetical protein
MTPVVPQPAAPPAEPVRVALLPLGSVSWTVAVVETVGEALLALL